MARFKELLEQPLFVVLVTVAVTCTCFVVGHLVDTWLTARRERIERLIAVEADLVRGLELQLRGRIAELEEENQRLRDVARRTVVAQLGAQEELRRLNGRNKQMANELRCDDTNKTIALTPTASGRFFVPSDE